MGLLDGKVAIVTGAARGIGKAIALKFASEGANVAFTDLVIDENAQQTEKEIAALGVKAKGYASNAANFEDTAKVVEQIHADFGRIDILVNNAGISSEVYFLDASEEDFDRMTAIDWKGLYFSSQAAARSMIDRNIKGVIINISSNQAEGCWPRATIYGPTKAAVSKFTKNAAMELSLYGIRMVAVAPGYTDVGWEKGDIRLEAASRLPFRRFATMDEIAYLVSYAASDEAAYMTGNTIVMEGGATLPVVAANYFV